MVTKLKYGNTNTYFIRGTKGSILLDTDYAGTLQKKFYKFEEKTEKKEFVGVNDENFIYDWWHYGSWKNNCVPTAQTGFAE